MMVAFEEMFPAILFLVQPQMKFVLLPGTNNVMEDMKPEFQSELSMDA